MHPRHNTTSSSPLSFATTEKIKNTSNRLATTRSSSQKTKQSSLSGGTQNQRPSWNLRKRKKKYARTHTHTHRKLGFVMVFSQLQRENTPLALRRSSRKEGKDKAGREVYHGCRNKDPRPPKASKHDNLSRPLSSFSSSSSSILQYKQKLGANLWWAW